MKKHRAIGLLLMIIFSFVVIPAFAQEPEAGAAAQLAMHTPYTDERVDRLEAYLNWRHSPLSSETKHIIAEADRLNIDWKLIPAIAGVESTFCQHIPAGSFNCWGWGIPTGAQYGVGFDNLGDGITTVSEGLRYKYINYGAVTIEQIGRIYAASPVWAYKVRFFIDQIDSFAPNSSDLLDVTI